MSIKNIFKKKGLETSKDYIIVDSHGFSNNPTMARKASKILAKAIGSMALASSAVVVAGAVIAFTTAPLMYDNLNAKSLSSSQSIIEDGTDSQKGSWLSHSDITNHLDAKSLEMNERYANGNVIMINQADENLDYLLSNIDPRFIPNIGHEYSMLNSPVDWFKEVAVGVNIDIRGGEKTRNWAHYKMENTDRGPHVYSKAAVDKGDLIKIGWIKPIIDTEHFKPKGRYKSPVLFSNEDMNVFVRHHEESHGQDLGEHHIHELNKVNKPVNRHYAHQTEVIADIYASLQSAAIIGNFNQAKHVVLPFRVMNYKDVKHQSAPYVEKLIDSGIDLDKLANMSDSELWAEAGKFYLEHNFETPEIKERAEIINLSGELFDVDLNDSLEYQRKAGKLEGITGKKIDEILTDYGNYATQIYADHIQYKNAGALDDAKIGLLKIVNRTAEISGDKEIEAKASSMIEKLEDGESVDFFFLLTELEIKPTISDMAIVTDYEKLDAVESERVARVENIQSQLSSGTFQPGAFTISHTAEKQTNAQHKFINKFNSKVYVDDHSDCSH